MTGIQLAMRTGIDQSYLSKLESGKVRFTVDRLTKILAALGATPSSFFGNDNVSEIPLGHGMRVPVLDYVQASEPVGSVAQLAADHMLNCVSVDHQATEDHDLFALTIKGNSMLPQFQTGDCVIMQRSLSPEPGDYVAAVTGASEAVFKRYKVLKTDDQKRLVFALVPLNDDFPTLRSDELPLLVRATMVEHRRFRNP